MLNILDDDKELKYKICIYYIFQHLWKTNIELLLLIQKNASRKSANRNAKNHVLSTKPKKYA
jgi:hypothetical protein